MNRSKRQPPPKRVLQFVYAVKAPIPALGALPGDEIVLTPKMEGFQVVVMRRFPMEMAHAISEKAVRQLSVVTVSGGSESVPSAQPAGERTLRLA